jgi:glycerophosphoryl diester phosphodiesterase
VERDSEQTIDSRPRGHARAGPRGRGRPRRRALAAALAGLGAAAPLAAEPAAAAAPKRVIAHRGASGYLPEHTLAAYALAHGQGAHFIEPDLVMTRDAVLVARHDLTLEATTDAAEVFPGRARADGRWYAADLDLAEVGRLRARDPRSGGFRAAGGGYRVPSFDEVLELLAELNARTGCRVGVYPELKEPAIHARAGLPLEEALLASLERFGYRGRDARVRIQSFDPRSLRRLRFELGSELPLVQLVAADPSQDALVGPAGLDEVARYADGIGVDKRRLAAAGRELVAAAHARGLFVDAWTFRRDEVAPAHASFEAELRALAFGQGVDGVFADEPDAALDALFGASPWRRWLGWRTRRPAGCATG